MPCVSRLATGVAVIAMPALCPFAAGFHGRATCSGRWPSFFAQHGVAAFIFATLFTGPSKPICGFGTCRLQKVADLRSVPDWVSIVALAFMLLSGWVLASLTFRRCADANISGWIAAPVVAPLFQILSSWVKYPSVARTFRERCSGSLAKPKRAWPRRRKVCWPEVEQLYTSVLWRLARWVLGSMATVCSWRCPS